MEYKDFNNQYSTLIWRCNDCSFSSFCLCWFSYHRYQYTFCLIARLNFCCLNPFGQIICNCFFFQFFCVFLCTFFWNCVFMLYDIICDALGLICKKKWLRTRHHVDLFVFLYEVSHASLSSVKWIHRQALLHWISVYWLIFVLNYLIISPTRCSRNKIIAWVT